MRRGGTGSAGGRSAGERTGGGRSGGGGPDSARLVALAALAVVALNFPLLLVWDRPASVLGLPLLGVAVFVIWAGLIAALVWVTERAPSPPRARTGVTDASLMPEAPAPAAPGTPTTPPEARR
ncbi:hypothetical protein [Paracoccus sanguinis]|uniref:Uncharacterized protein n=1 Tax=Paracoccus sanguinis TaxID=1545044 RepID=A0A1H2ZIS4_9RHOB|nr:hypothetical protein [Paracoccus sanguinis]SDX16619.1 hypothetical protein SAMN05444276_10377 [Paracoccus sanguinis]